MCEDYSEQETLDCINELLTVHVAKLKHTEVIYLQRVNELVFTGFDISQGDRDIITAMYDRIGEGSY